MVPLTASAFARGQVTVIVSGQGGRVSSSDAGLSCDAGATCSQWVRLGQELRLRLNPAPFFGLSAWGGLCADAGASPCALNVTGNVSVSATFARMNTVFVTEQQFNGNLDGGAGATQRCVSAAIDAGFAQPTSYVAWLGDSALPQSATAPARLVGSRGWARTDGLPVADTAADFAAGRFIYPPNLTALGRRDAYDRVWSGHFPDGGVATDTCLNWSNGSFGLRGQLGFASASGDAWTQGDTHPCGLSYALYCVGTGANAQPVVNEPPPGSRRAFLSSPVTANLSNAAADLQCQSEAASAGLAGATRYKVLRSDVNASGLSRFTPDGGAWYRLDDALWATPENLANASQTPTTPLDVLANGQRVPETAPVPVWTGGSILSATTQVASCSGWTDNGSSVGAQTGNGRSAGTESSYGAHAFIPAVGGGRPCNLMARLYCVQD